MKTYATKPSHVQARWHVIDARDQILGRLATEVSVLLQGKNKPIFARHIITGDFVVIVNAEKVKVTGKKLQQKMYRRHSGYPGALKETTLARLQERHPDRVIRSAVKGMLPSNTSGRHMLRRLKVYAGDEHPHQAQVRFSETMEPLTMYQDLRTTVAASIAIADETQAPVAAMEATAAVVAAPEAQAEPIADNPVTPPVAEVEAEGSETPETTDQESDESETAVEPDSETPNEKVEG